MAQSFETPRLKPPNVFHALMRGSNKARIFEQTKMLRHCLPRHAAVVRKCRDGERTFFAKAKDEAKASLVSERREERCRSLPKCRRITSHDK